MRPYECDLGKLPSSRDFTLKCMTGNIGKEMLLLGL